MEGPLRCCAGCGLSKARGHAQPGFGSVGRQEVQASELFISMQVSPVASMGLSQCHALAWSVAVRSTSARDTDSNAAAESCSKEAVSPNSGTDVIQTSRKFGLSMTRKQWLQLQTQLKGVECEKRDNRSNMTILDVVQAAPKNRVKDTLSRKGIQQTPSALAGSWPFEAACCRNHS